MAFDKTPTTWIPSWASDGTTVSAPIASFPALTSAKANATTGDIRKIVQAVAEKLYAKYASLVTADRPLRMEIKREIREFNGALTGTYTFTFALDTFTAEVKAE